MGRASEPSLELLQICRKTRLLTASWAPGGHWGAGHHARHGFQGPGHHAKRGFQGPGHHVKHGFHGPAGGQDRAQRSTAHLCDAGVRTLAVGARQLQPLALVNRAVLPEGALPLALAPAAFEVWVRLEAQPTALTHGPTLIEVNCRQRTRGVWMWGQGRRQPGVWTGNVVLASVWDTGSLVPSAFWMQKRLGQKNMAER